MAFKEERKGHVKIKMADDPFSSLGVLPVSQKPAPAPVATGPAVIIKKERVDPMSGFTASRGPSMSLDASDLDFLAQVDSAVSAPAPSRPPAIQPQPAVADQRTRTASADTAIQQDKKREETYNEALAKLLNALRAERSIDGRQLRLERYRASGPSLSCVALRAIITTLRSDAERLSAVSLFVSTLTDLEENWTKLLHGLPETEALTMKKVLQDYVIGKRRQGEGPVVNYEGSTKQAPHPSPSAGAQQPQQQQSWTSKVRDERKAKQAQVGDLISLDETAVVASPSGSGAASKPAPTNWEDIFGTPLRTDAGSLSKANINTGKPPMSEPALAVLLSNLVSTGFDEKLTSSALREASNFHHVTCSQLARILSLLHFPNVRETCCALFSGKIIDPNEIMRALAVVESDGERTALAYILRKPYFD